MPSVLVSFAADDKSLDRIDRGLPAPEERYDPNRDIVVFWGRDKTQRIRCAISRETFDDHFQGDNRNKLEVFAENRLAIEDIARRKYLSGHGEPDGTVLIRTVDIPY